MAEPDYTLAAHPYVPPATNPLETLQGIERYRILQNQTSITGNEAKQKQIDTDALSNWGKTRDPVALEGASPELRTSAIAGDINEQQNKKDVMSRDAAYIQGEKDPEIKKYLWQKKGEEYKRKGWVPAEVWDKHKDTPNDQILGNLARGNMSVPDYRATTGQTAGAEAGARAPYQTEQIDPTKPLVRPGVMPGGSVANGTPAGDIWGGQSPPGGPAAPAPGSSAAPPAAPATAVAPGAPSGTGVAPPRSKNVTDTQATVVPPATPPAGSPAAQPGKNATAVDKTNPYSAEVPEVKVGNDLPTGPGVINQGIDPLRQAARTEGLKKFNEDIEPTAAAAAHTRASLGTMKAGLDKGVTTDRLGDLKTSIGAFLYAMTKDPKFTKDATGLDVSNQEVFNKESTRMGLTFARQTEGAREAVAAIRIALGANPSLLNSEEGNRKIIGIMDQSAKYDQERAKAAQAYMAKNDGHLTGFDTWFSTAHPPAAFISKAIPYNVPPGGKSAMQDGVTYEFKFGNKMARGTYDAQTGHMVPVQQ